MAEPAKKRVRAQTLHSDNAEDVATASNYKHVTTTHYHLEFQVCFENKKIKGNAQLRMKCLQSCKQGNGLHFTLTV